MQLIKRIANAWAAFTVICTAISCAQGPGDFSLLQGLPIPEGAYEVQRLNLHDSPKNQQLFFKVERRYPAVDVLDLYNGYFRREQWIACHSSSDTWDWFLDKSSKPPQYVHQVASYWISSDRRMFAVASARYFSVILATSNAPDNSVQRWAILVQKDVNALDEAKRLSLRCSDPVQPANKS